MEDDNILDFTIILDDCSDGQRIYYSGGKVTGQVVVELNEPITVRNIGLQLEGEAYCHWTETERSGDRKRTKHYTGNDLLVRLVDFVFGNPPGGLGEPTKVHPSGRHSYPFVFELPRDLPSSVEGRLGHVRYTLKATVSRPVTSNYEIKQEICIREVLNVNDQNILTQPGGSVSKEIGCCCLPSGILSLSTSLCRSAFCLGEGIIINAQVTNDSRTNMRAIKAKLIQTIEFHARTEVKRDTQVISTALGLPVPAGQSGTFGDQPLNVPQTTPTITNSVIKLYYDVVVEVDVPWGLDLDVTMPVTIGIIQDGNTDSVTPQGKRVKRNHLTHC